MKYLKWQMSVFIYLELMKGLWIFLSEDRQIFTLHDHFWFQHSLWSWGKSYKGTPNGWKENLSLWVEDRYYDSNPNSLRNRHNRLDMWNCICCEGVIYSMSQSLKRSHAYLGHILQISRRYISRRKICFVTHPVSHGGGYSSVRMYKHPLYSGQWYMSVEINFTNG